MAEEKIAYVKVEKRLFENGKIYNVGEKDTWPFKIAMKWKHDPKDEKREITILDSTLIPDKAMREMAGQKGPNKAAPIIHDIHHPAGAGSSAPAAPSAASPDKSKENAGAPGNAPTDKEKEEAAGAGSKKLSEKLPKMWKLSNRTNLVNLAKDIAGIPDAESMEKYPTKRKLVEAIEALIEKEEAAGAKE